jgi:hypothetical protein
MIRRELAPIQVNLRLDRKIWELLSLSMKPRILNFMEQTALFNAFNMS